jgi:aspartate 1-decarboxylase
MKIETVTPKKTYKIVDCNGKTSRVVQPGDRLSVIAMREFGEFSILSVQHNGETFDIPERAVHICEQLELA